MILLPPLLAYDKAPAQKRAAGILLVNYDNEALFTRRADTGEWSIPFGGVEEGETPEQAAKREFGEETGYGPKSGDWSNIRQIDEHDGATTFMATGTTTQFTPVLNDEHTEAQWSSVHEPPDPMHPNLKRVLASLTAARANDEALVLAFDRSVQRMDPDGRLHIETANISKANVCPYLGSEIPGHEELGLDPNKIYYLLRDPEELAKAAPTFNNIPVLDEHIPHSADDPQEDKVIGTTGSEASFEAPYLRNSLAFWKEGQIGEIRSKERRQLSASYRYRPDMTPGVYLGVKYDGVMRDIIGNHVALVKDGRAGDDVMVGDSMKELILMAKNTKKPLSGIAAFALGSLSVHLKPKLATDARMDLSKHLVGVTRKNFSARKAAVAEAITKAATPLLAADAQLDDVLQLLDAVEKVGMDDETMAAPVDGTMDADFPPKKDDKAKDEPPPFKAEPKAKDSDEDDDDKADDEDDDDDKKKTDDAEMSGEPAKGKVLGKDAVNRIVAKAVADANATNAAVRQAEREVAPWVGDLAIAYDSPDKVYAAALELVGFDTKGIHPSAFPAILKMQKKPGDVVAMSPASQFAHDSASATGFAERFPEASRIRSLG